jgi:hypothetical protein
MAWKTGNADANLEFSQRHGDPAEAYPGVAVLGLPDKNLFARGDGAEKSQNPIEVDRPRTGGKEERKN